MNETQTNAFNIYMDSATLNNGYTPMSFVLIAERLTEEGIKASKSSVGRWSIKFKWKEFLETKISASLIKDKEVVDLIEKSSISAMTQRTIDDFKSNENLKNLSYMVLEAQVTKYSEKLKQGTYLNHKEEVFILKLLEVTAGREDKMLDRKAVLASSRLINSEDALKALRETTIDVEIEVEE